MSHWRKKDIQSIQIQIKESLDGVAVERSDPARLRYMLDQISRLEDAMDSQVQLQRYLFTIFALVHHERYGGIPKPRLARIIDLAYALLAVNRVKPQTSKLAYLYGELHLVISQISLKEGHSLRSSWQQAMARSFSGDQFPGGDHFYHLAMGIRFFRLGFLPEAIEHFEKVSESDLPENSRLQGKAYLVKSYRLSDQFNKARVLCESFLAMKDSDPGFQEELQWELACLKLSETLDPADCVMMVQKGKSHYHSTYVLEAFLWSHALKTLAWNDRFFKLKTYGKHFKLKHDDQSYVLCQKLEDAYDSSIDFIVRVRQLGECLEGLERYIDHQKRLLFLLGTSRWLQRYNQYALAHITLNEYKALSLRLSQGKSSDVLHLAADLIKNEGVSHAV
ncbi:hypothetical protein [Pseudobacteriovorax antillogorgiicola]|uniref:Tetratricopeptide repeat-containing protein n=1 Tax=Pseudobacteriovorax antillogorgiicola TaxID=1513793 RepID=A0A1Y6CST2_9BACT|nr:hypothetical protein [Pseudobacteriovorax antillogorgiicola]TCS45896.1 hypothetical protein EDD56_12659 [Pseudobacteriovorax antillogorgiicola]SMF71154.1 hypothetical protein SAMN06296036_12639 [Pseudobacteriovorax antillogorgiicola]